MRCLFIILIVLFGLRGISQPGFNQSYDFGQLAAGFGSLELSGDTLVVYGTIKQNNQPSFGLLFAQVDTLGNLIHYTVYNDSLGHDFTAVKPNSFIKLSSNSGYAGVAHIFQRTNGCLGLFDNQGELTKFIEFEDANSIVDFYKEVIEVADGFLVLGDKQNASNWVLDIFIMKTDFEGNKIWEKKFATPGRRTLFGNVLILDENEYVISATTTTVQGVPLPQVRNTSKIFAIDSLGNIKWQWESQPSLEELGAGSISRTPEGNWAYTSGRGWYNATYNEISRQPKFIIRDENFNLIREDTFGIADFPVNGLHKALPLNDEGWLLIGVKPVHYPLPPVPMWYNSFSGWMVRLDSQGDELWSRVDTAFWSYETGSTNYYYDAVELPSGSLVVCGYSRTYEPAPKDWGWLIKVSPDGCLDTLFCSPVSAVSPIVPDLEVSLYPNPASSTVHIRSEGVAVWDRIEVYNAAGQALRVLHDSREGRVELGGLPDGLYFIRLVKGGRAVTKKVIKRR